MGTERLGAVRKVDLTAGVVLEVSAVYPNEDEDASPVAYHVEVWQRVASDTRSLAEVKRLIAAFGATSNDW